MKRTEISQSRNITYHQPPSPIHIKRQIRIPQTEKLVKNKTIKFTHKRSPTSWKSQINQEVHVLYNKILSKNQTTIYQHNVHQHSQSKNKTIYQRFQHIMKTSDLWKANRKKHQRQTTGLTEKKTSLLDSPLKRKHIKQNQLIICLNKVQELINRNVALKQQANKIKNQILKKFNLANIQLIR